MDTRQPTPLRPYDAPEPIMRQAGAWLARRDRGLSAAEQLEFEMWLMAHPSHEAAVAQLERTMTAFDSLRELAPEAVEFTGEPDPDFFAPPRRKRSLLFPSLAAAGIAAALALIVWQRSTPPEPTSWHYATAASSYERATLPDGSTLELNGDTIVDVDYTTAARTLRLSRGEAHFQVAKNPARPFVVNAHGVAFRAVGTAFNVRLNPGDVEMLVTEGKVQVEPSALNNGSNPVSSGTSASSNVGNALPFGQNPALPLLVAGQKIVVPSGHGATPVIAALSAAEIDRTLAWQPRVAEFKKTPLSEVVAAFNRQNHAQIVIADPSLMALRVGGNFRVDQPEAFVRLLETSFGIAAEHTGETITLHKAP